MCERKENIMSKNFIIATSEEKNSRTQEEYNIKKTTYNTRLCIIHAFKVK